MFRLRFTSLVEAPLTVAFDVARALGRPWPFPLHEVSSRRPSSDLYAAGAVRGWRELTHARWFVPTGAGTLVTEQVDGRIALPALLGGAVEELVVRRRILRAMQAYLDGYAAAAATAARSVLQVVGAAVVDDGRVLVARRHGGPYDGQWEFPGGKVEPGEPELGALVRECREELGLDVAPQSFLGEVVLDGVVGGGPPGASTMRLWWARPVSGVAEALEHTEVRWVRADELDALDWIAADRPLLPAVRTLLTRTP